MSGGIFITKFPFKCFYCKRSFKPGVQVVHIFYDGRNACSSCAEKRTHTIQHGPYDSREIEP